MTMFQNLEIRNFRLFEHLKVEKLGRINLLAGENNSGKTSFLEALILLCGAGNPRLILAVSKLRFEELNLNKDVREIYFKPLFHRLSFNQPIDIIGKEDSLGSMKLTITVERRNLITLPFLDKTLTEQKHPMTTSDDAWSSDLCLQYTLNQSEETQKVNYLRTESDGIRIEDSSREAPSIQGTFISGKSGGPREDATNLGSLRKHKQGGSLVNILKMIEPRLESLEENSVAGYPMIWGDIGLPELVPLSIMGEGMTRIARIFLAIPNITGGILLVDEIENGIHYSVLEKVWSAIADAAERAQVQIFATTHSFECMEAAHKALGEKLMFHRIEDDREGRKRCVTLEAEGVAAAIRHGFEVR